VAMIVSHSPRHIVSGAAMVRTGKSNTVTAPAAEPIHPFWSVPNTVYTIVTAGRATGSGQAVQLKPVGGDHTYVEAPEAASVAESPAQNSAVVNDTIGNGFTMTTTESLA